MRYCRSYRTLWPLLVPLLWLLPGASPLAAQERSLAIGTVSGQFGLSSPNTSQPFVDYLESRLPTCN